MSAFKNFDKITAQIAEKRNELARLESESAAARAGLVGAIATGAPSKETETFTKSLPRIESAVSEARTMLEALEAAAPTALSQARELSREETKQYNADCLQRAEKICSLDLSAPLADVVEAADALEALRSEMISHQVEYARRFNGNTSRMASWEPMSRHGAWESVSRKMDAVRAIARAAETFIGR